MFLYQQTPLHVAAAKGHEHTVKALLDKTPNVDIKDKDGVSVYVRQSAKDCWLFAQTLMHGQRNNRLIHMVWKFVTLIKSLLARNMHFSYSI